MSKFDLQSIRFVVIVKLTQSYQPLIVYVTQHRSHLLFIFNSKISQEKCEKIRLPDNGRDTFNDDSLTVSPSLRLIPIHPPILTNRCQFVAQKKNFFIVVRYKCFKQYSCNKIAQIKTKIQKKKIKKFSLCSK